MSNLKKLREQKGYTQEALAARAGVSSQTISNLECERHEWTVDTLRKISRALNVSMQVLLGKDK